jgi:hypothetical protein
MQEKNHQVSDRIQQNSGIRLVDQNQEVKNAPSLEGESRGDKKICSGEILLF